MHLETRVVFFRCSSYIFTSSVQFSSSSSSLVKKLWKKMEKDYSESFTQNLDWVYRVQCNFWEIRKMWEYWKALPHGYEVHVQRQVDDAWRLWAPMILCNKAPKISPRTTLCKLQQCSIFLLRKKVKGVTTENTYSMLVTVHSLCNCLLSASHKLADWDLISDWVTDSKLIMLAELQANNLRHKLLG